jgi:hypothetical protein
MVIRCGSIPVLFGNPDEFIRRQDILQLYLSRRILAKHYFTGFDVPSRDRRKQMQALHAMPDEL